MSMPELGSKISLISKADIRYEGKLFTVDPQECTIALSHGNIFFFIYIGKTIFSFQVINSYLHQFIFIYIYYINFQLFPNYA